MKTWREYEDQRSKQESNASNAGQEALGNISLDGRGEDALSVMYMLVNLAWENHRKETKSFFNKLSKKDPYIQQEWEKIEKEAARFAGSGSDADDVVMIPNADSGNGDDEGGDD